MSIHAVTCKLRQAFQYLLKDDRAQPRPGFFSATSVKSAGRVLCQIAIVHAIPSLEDETLLCVHFVTDAPGVFLYGGTSVHHTVDAACATVRCFGVMRLRETQTGARCFSARDRVPAQQGVPDLPRPRPAPDLPGCAKKP